MFRIRLVRTAFVFAAVITTVATPGWAASPAPAAASLPAATVTAFHDTLTDAMSRSAKLGCEGRMQLVQSAVDTTFDLPFLAERALRRHWKNLDAAQRERFAAALRTSVVTTYATEFATPGAVRFATGNSSVLASGDALVHTTLTPSDRSAITLDYVLKPRGERWQVVNVLADGVSDLALRATQYDGTLKSEGFEALMGKLDAQTKALKARCK
ncbi:MAG: ABC transporter substrate-binding protein [Stagnimonas sp.]|nr:ABC transporter substrate-binding protein [Stagnimonas sp.]